MKDPIAQEIKFYLRNYSSEEDYYDIYDDNDYSDEEDEEEDYEDVTEYCDSDNDSWNQWKDEDWCEDYDNYVIPVYFPRCIIRSRSSSQCSFYYSQFCDYSLGMEDYSDAEEESEEEDWWTVKYSHTSKKNWTPKRFAKCSRRKSVKKKKCKSMKYSLKEGIRFHLKQLASSHLDSGCDDDEEDFGYLGDKGKDDSYKETGLETFFRMAFGPSEVAPTLPCNDVVSDAENLEDEAEEVVTPLMIPELLSSVLLKLEEVSDLKAVRLVCKLWRDVTVEQWRKAASFPISARGNWRRNPWIVWRKYYVARQIVNYDQLVQLPGEADRVKVVPAISNRHTLLNDIIFPLDANVNEEVIKEEMAYQTVYWKEFGASLNYLHIPRAFFQWEEEIDGFEWIWKHCPNLEELKIGAFFTWPWVNVWEFNDDDEERRRELDKIYAINLQSVTFLFRRRCCYRCERTPHGQGTCSDRKEVDWNVDTVIEFLEMAPNLKNLKLDFDWIRFEWKDYLAGDQYDYVAAFLGGLATENQRQIGGIHRLEKLEIVNAKLDRFDLNYLMDYVQISRPSMKTLKLWIDLEEARSGETDVSGRIGEKFEREFVDNEAFLRTLQLLRDTLECLDLKVSVTKDCFNFNNELEGISFSQLTELHLHFVYDGVPEGIISLPIFDFKSLSKMQKLRIFRYNASGGVIILSADDDGWVEGEVNGNLREFNFNGRCTTKVLKLLSRQMPNLRVVTMAFDNQTFPLIFKLWAILERVTICIKGSKVRGKLISDYGKRFPWIQIKQGGYVEKGKDRFSGRERYTKCEKEWEKLGFPTCFDHFPVLE